MQYNNPTQLNLHSLRRFLSAAVFLGSLMSIGVTARCEEAETAPSVEKPKPTLNETLNWLKEKFEGVLPLQNQDAAGQKVKVSWTDDLDMVTIRMQYYSDPGCTRRLSYYELYEVRLSDLSIDEMMKDKEEEKRGVLLSPLRWRKVDDRDADKNWVKDDVDERFVFANETMASRVTNAFKYAADIARARRSERDGKPEDEPF